MLNNLACSIFITFLFSLFHVQHLINRTTYITCASGRFHFHYISYYVQIHRQHIFTKFAEDHTIKYTTTGKIIFIVITVLKINRTQSHCFSLDGLIFTVNFNGQLYNTGSVVPK